MQLLDPKLDVVFKLLFAHPANGDLLGSMIAAVLRLPAPPESVLVLNPGLLGDVSTGKAIVLDVRARLADGTLLDIEMETQPRPATPARFLYYWARLHASQLARGNDYQRLHRTISILWLDGLVPAVARRFHSTFHLREATTGALLSDQIELHLLALPNLSESDPPPPLARWARFLLASDAPSLHALAAEDVIMSKAVQELERLSADPMTEEMLEGIRRAELFRKHEMWEAREEGIEQGIEKGIEQGIAKGIEKGIEQGIERGRDAIVRSMLARGADVTQVAALTGLSEDVVRAIAAPPEPSRG